MIVSLDLNAEFSGLFFKTIDDSMNSILYCNSKIHKVIFTQPKYIFCGVG
jgi:hypothetical protein